MNWRRAARRLIGARDQIVTDPDGREFNLDEIREHAREERLEFSPVHVFISHTRTDHDYLTRTLAPGSGRNGPGVHFMNGAGPTANIANAYKSEVVKNIVRARWFVVALSEGALKLSKWVPFEVRCAAYTLRTQQIVVLRLDDCTSEELHPALSHAYLIDCRNDAGAARRELLAHIGRQSGPLAL